jgi:transposase-like protein
MTAKTKRTPEIEAEIIMLYTAGTEVENLAKRFNMSERTVVLVLSDNEAVPRYGDGKWYRAGVENVVSYNIKQRVKEMFDQGMGSRKIAKELVITRHCVNAIRDEFGIDTRSRTPPRIAHLKTEHCCKICQITKPISDFRKRVKGDRVSFETVCKDCEYLLNKEKGNKRAKELRQTDPCFVLRKSISYSIWKMLKGFNVTKEGRSCLDFLGYTIEELKVHLEGQFESWMTWNTYGAYHRKTWKDADQTTWTWQIDHIIPQTDLPYASMEDENFRKCWALENLRPLNSKQNHSDGVKLIRHQSKKRKPRNK